MRIFTETEVHKLVEEIDEDYRPYTGNNTLGSFLFFQHRDFIKPTIDLENVKSTLNMLLNLTIAQGANNEWIEVIEARKTINKLKNL